MKLAVITDSSAYLKPEVLEKENLFILDIPVFIDGKTYVEGKNLTEEELETVLLKYKFEVESYVENSLAPEILDLILIKGTLHSFYEKLENITYLDLLWYIIKEICVFLK